VKHLLFAAAFVVELVAWIASAGSLLIRIDGWPGWLVSLAVFAVIVGLWQAAMCRRAPWPLPLSLHYVCKAMLYTFAALVLWFYADWAGMAFAASVVVTEPLVVRYRLHPELREAEPVLSRAAGRVA
jgi:hypothetical protein